MREKLGDKGRNKNIIFINNNFKKWVKLCIRDFKRQNKLRFVADSAVYLMVQTEIYRFNI